jgi:hypothetical protein
MRGMILQPTVEEHDREASRPSGHCATVSANLAVFASQTVPERISDRATQIGRANRSSISDARYEGGHKVNENGYAHPHALVETSWVESHWSDPNVRLVEVDVDTTAYGTGHIPKALGWDWRADLQRHPVRDIPDQAEWESLLSRSGIGNNDLVVLYGDNNKCFAAFAYWGFKV